MSSAFSFFSAVLCLLLLPCFVDDDIEVIADMSGIEVVGVVLALFPVIVNSVRNYRNVKSGQPLQSLITDVLAEQLIFRTWIGHLLMPTVPVEGLKDMLDPTSQRFARWHDPSLRTDVERAFGRATTTYLLTTLGEIHKELEEIKEALKYTTKTLAENAATRICDNLRTIRYTREGSSLRGQLKRLQQLNAKLGQVFAVSGANALHSTERSNTIAWLPSLAGYDHATNLYHAVRKSYQCTCTGPHLTKLRLPPVKPPRVRTHSASRNRRIAISNLLFSVEESESEHEAGRLMLGPLATHSPRESDTSIVSTVRPEDESLIDLDSSFRSGRASSSEISHDFSDLSIVGSNMTTNTMFSRSGNSKSCAVSVHECIDSGAEQIVDLCKSIRSLNDPEHSQSGSTRIGTLPSVGGKTYELVADQPEQHSAIESMTSLEDIFTSSQYKLARGLRIELAVRLSTAVLHLCTTPWISRSWSWRDFSVTALHGRQQDDRNLFIAHQFYTERTMSTAIDRGHGDLVMLTPGEPVLTRLGFALIEMAFGKRLASMQGQVENVRGDPYYRDLAVAAALLNTGQLLSEEGTRYHQAVLTCLKQEVTTQDGYGNSKRSLDIQNPCFKQDAITAILQPLVGLWAADFGGGIESMA